MPTPSYLFAGVLFGAIGSAAFLYGRRQGKWQPLLFGSCLVLSTLVTGDTQWLWIIGVALCAAMYWFRD